MEPHRQARTLSATHIQAPHYLTGTTNNVTDWKAVIVWQSFFKNRSLHDDKGKADLSAVGLILYLSCDEKAREFIDRAEIDNRININEEDGDEKCSQIVKKILEIIVKDPLQAVG